MRIERKRYVVMRKNRTEVWCGLAKAARCSGALSGMHKHQLLARRLP